MTEPPADLPPTPPRAILVMRLMTVAAMAISAFLFYASLRGGAVAGCSPGSGFDCESVLAARQWSYWCGVPVSAPALVIYLLMFYDLLHVGDKRPVKERMHAWGLLGALGLLVAGAAIWFTAVQLLILDKTCLYCMIAHALGVALCVMIYQYRPRGARAGAMAVVTPLALIMLVGGQLAYQPPSMKRTVLDSRVTLDADKYPIMGSPSAEHVLVYLFDYTCPHCHELNKNMKLAMQRYGDQIAFIKLPVPLNSDCNRVVKNTRERHRTACDLAKLALAVWRAQPESFGEFDRFLFANDKPPTVEAAQARAAGLVGQDKLAAALKDPWINEQIEKDIKLYELASKESGTRSIPQIVGNNFIIAGQPGLPEQLFAMLEQQLGVVP